MKRVLILTGSERRHTFFRLFLGLSEQIRIVRTYCEGLEKSLTVQLSDQPDPTFRLQHIHAREQSEEDFFGLFIRHVPDRSVPVFIPKGDINSTTCFEEIISLSPDLIAAYGCSLIRDPLLSAFEGRFLNVHLGLSPYYRGSGTNYWPLVRGEPEYAGATFMHIDAGIDTGPVIHQIRARLCWGDTPSSIGNRLIVDMAYAYRRILEEFNRLEPMSPLPPPKQIHVCKSKDFTEESVERLYENFQNGMVEQYLREQVRRCSLVPILANPALQGL
ncbi:MAG: hypothetical protein JW828_05815 [Sedimentisphaerales bacterium]|nr:hypothetical protein [Sedimentisphaerales bacterium]